MRVSSWLVVFLFLGLLSFQPGHATAAQSEPKAAVVKPYRPALDPRSWRKAVVGPPTQVMVLGSPHLSELPPGFQAAFLEPLLAKLMAFAPDVITYEGISGEECELLQRHAPTYPDMFKTYCNDLGEAGRAVGLDFVGARAEVAQTLARWASQEATVQPTPAQRRRLVAVFIAAGDRPSAVVQWLQLSPSERMAQDGVAESFLPMLGRSSGRFNENVDVAAVLAARLGHARIYAVDNHTADSIQAEAGAAFEAALKQHWKTASDPKDPVIQRYANDMRTIKNGDDALAFYRFINEPRTQLTFIRTDYLKSLQDRSPERFGRQYVAWWETRNLRMVANVRSAFGNRPGAKVLNVVGASHKPYYEAYLDLMHDVQLIDALAVLR